MVAMSDPEKRIN